MKDQTIGCSPTAKCESVGQGRNYDVRRRNNELLKDVHTSLAWELGLGGA